MEDAYPPIRAGFVDSREVLSRINAVLVVAGLNDTIFSIRDCNSTLFLLLFKKVLDRSALLPAAGQKRPASARAGSSRRDHLAKHCAHRPSALPPPHPQLFTWRLSGVVAEPSSKEDHATNYEILLSAISSDVLEMDLSHISPDQLAQGAGSNTHFTLVRDSENH